MRKQLVLTAFAQFFAITFLAQSFGEIHGTVTGPDGKPLDMASVTAFDGVNTVGAYTDEQGKYKIKPLVPGKYTLRCNSLNLVEYVVEEFMVNADQISKADMEMVNVEGSKATGPVIYGDPLINKNGGTQIILRYEDLKNMPTAKGGNIVGAIKTMTPDIKSNARGTELYFRGSRAGSTLFLIDGMKIRENTPGIPSSAIASIMVYTGGVPAKYGDCTGGVVVVDTKSYLAEYYAKLNE